MTRPHGPEAMVQPTPRIGLVLCFALVSFGIITRAADEGLSEGSTFALGGRRATVTTLQSLPYVDSEYTRRFRFDSADNPKLKELRERHRLDLVIAPGAMNSNGRSSSMRTFTPNFDRFEVRLDRGEWHPTEPAFTWNPHPGTNQLEARTVNRFGIQGPISSAAVSVQ